jgi:hypothetical protein
LLNLTIVTSSLFLDLIYTSWDEGKEREGKDIWKYIIMYFYLALDISFLIVEHNNCLIKFRKRRKL